MRRSPRIRPLAAAALAAALLALASPGRAAAQTFHGPTPYLSFADSPFNGLAFGYFHLEDFEDALLNTPGVSLLEPGTAILAAPSPFEDSVDGDDGSVDGSGLGGHSLLSNSSTTSFTFDFSAAALGGLLPTHVGIVWTDVGQTSSGSVGSGNVVFEAFGPGLVSLGTLGPFALGDGRADLGGTAEDRFFGVAYGGGVARVVIRMPDSNDWEVDHLQYGRLSPSAVPEPTSLALAATGLAALAGGALRRRRPARR